MKKILTLLMMFVINISIVISQTSEFRNFSQSKIDDIDSIPIYLKIAQENEIHNPDSALSIYQKLLAVLPNSFPNKDSDINYLSYKGQILNNLSNVFIIYKTKFDTASNYSFEALKLFNTVLSISKDNKINNEVKTGRGISNLNIGRIYEKRGYYPLAIQNYLEATKIFTELNDEKHIAKCFINIGSIHDCIGDYKKSHEYYNKAIEILRFNKPSFDLAECLLYYGISYDALENQDSAFIFYNRAFDIYKSLKNIDGMGLVYHNIADTYVNYEKIFSEKNAKKYFLQSIKYYLSVGDLFSISETYSGLSNLYNKLKQYDTARNYALMGLRIAEKTGSLYLKCDPYHYLSNAYEGLGKTDSALQCLKLYKYVYDSLYSESYQKVCIDGLVKESVFNFDKEQQNKIVELQKKLVDKQDKIIFILIFVIIFVILSFFIIYKIRKTNIENKNKIKVRDSLIEGEEKERNRIGQELHDGVCSELSAVKMNLEILKNNSPIIEGIDKVIVQLNETNESIRNISHNLNSFILIKFGLFTAVSNLCEKIKDLNKVNLKLEITGINGQIEKSVGIIIYRIIQELLNNTIKHSKATEVEFKLNYRHNLMTIDIRDNGVGFDIKSENAENGIGLNNIRNRVAILNGKLKINSDKDIGTTIIIDIPITDNNYLNS